MPPEPTAHDETDHRARNTEPISEFLRRGALGGQTTNLDDLSLGEILRGVPRDPAAIFVYLMFIGSGVVIWKGSLHPGSPKDPSGGKP